MPLPLPADEDGEPPVVPGLGACVGVSGVGAERAFGKGVGRGAAMDEDLWG